MSRAKDAGTFHSAALLVCLGVRTMLSAAISLQDLGYSWTISIPSALSLRN